jgi:hypothetical protein
MLHKTIFVIVAFVIGIISLIFAYLGFVFLAWAIVVLANLTFGLNLEINIWAAGGLLFALHVLVKLFLGKSEE